MRRSRAWTGSAAGTARSGPGTCSGRPAPPWPNGGSRNAPRPWKTSPSRSTRPGNGRDRSPGAPPAARPGAGALGGRFPGSAEPDDGWWRPGAVEDGLLRPVGPQVQRERPGGGGQPVAPQVVIAGPGGGGGQGQRPVGGVVQALVLGAQRVPVQFVGVEEVMLVVQRQRPEAPDRRQPMGREGHRVGA